MGDGTCQILLREQVKRDHSSLVTDCKGDWCDMKELRGLEKKDLEVLCFSCKYGTINVVRDGTEVILDDVACYRGDAALPIYVDPRIKCDYYRKICKMAVKK